MITYYVLSNEDGVILGVYGSAIADMARENGGKIARQTACKVALHCVSLARRPHVGESVSMRGAHEWL